MSKVKVVYWSGSGNTQAMADAVANGITSAGGEAEVTTFDALSPSEASKDSVIAFALINYFNLYIFKNIVSLFLDLGLIFFSF